jgi:hydrogenase expression/formation protein HypC
MCLGIPGEIVELSAERGDLAKVEVAGVRRAVNIGLLGRDALAPGDWVLVHVGFAMSKIDEAEAAATLDLLRGLGQAYTDELDALVESDIS